jgi:hypothetical protein
MRLIAFLPILGLCGSALAQDKLAQRYTYEVNLEAFPQKTPEEGLKSAVKAIATKKFDYLMAHLADPEYVDARVEKYKKLIPKGEEQGKTLLAFKRLVQETEDHFLEDPEHIQVLQRFAKEGQWKMEGAMAVAALKGVVGRHLFMKKTGDRWFLENRQR